MKTKNLTEIGQWKVGQPVLVQMGGASRRESIAPISKITDGRGGTIYVGEQLFDTDGHQRTSDSWNRAFIQPATEADVIRIKGKNARFRIANYDWQNLDPSKAIEIEKLLNENGIETKVRRT